MNDSDSSFDDLRQRARDLPREIGPSRDLWPDIRHELERAAKPSRPQRAWFPRAMLLAAGLALVVGATLWWWPSAQPAWTVAVLSGAPRVDGGTFSREGRWQKGQWLETDARSSARLDVGRIGEVRLDPNSRVRLLESKANEHRVELAHGTLHALIWAPPRLFFVNTPSATAIDLGCAYTLNVDGEGNSRLEVTAGYVALDHPQRTSIVPEGHGCETRVGQGPGTPFAEGAKTALREALRRFDSAAETVLLDEVLIHTAKGDEVTLWHLLTRAPAERRTAVYDKLSALAPPPAGVTREGILARNEGMLAAWGDAVGIRAGL